MTEDVVGLEVVGRCPTAFHGVGCPDAGFCGEDQLVGGVHPDDQDGEESPLSLLLFFILFKDFEFTSPSSFQFQVPDNSLFFLATLLLLISFFLFVKSC